MILFFFFFFDAGNTEANNEAEGVESRHDEDEETRSRKRMRLSVARLFE